MSGASKQPEGRRQGAGGDHPRPAAGLAQGLRARRAAPGRPRADAGDQPRRPRATATAPDAKVTPNPPVHVYDSSGPYTDPDGAHRPARRACPPCATAWIRGRGDTEELRRHHLASTAARARRTRA